MRTKGVDRVAPLYWVFDWLDANSLTSVEEARVLITKPTRARKSLREAADDAGSGSMGTAAGYDVVAGRGADLSGELDCMNHECQIRQVDEVLRRALFYFDTVEVAGLSPDWLAGNDGKLTEAALDNFLEHVWVLLDLRRRKLEDLLRFRPKPVVGDDYLAEAVSIGMADFPSVVNDWIGRFTREASISIERHGDHGHYQLSHPSLEHSVWGHVHPRPGFRLGKREAARDAVGKFGRALVSDVMAARAQNLALTSRWIVHHEWLANVQRDEVRVEDVFLELHLPVPNALAPERFRKFREDNSDAFEQFRHALSVGIRERSKVGTSREIAREVTRDLVEPSLREIRQRVAASDASLGRKVLLGGASSAAIVSVGLLLGAPLLAPIAAATAIPIYAAIQKHWDERTEIELKDMYFLWRAGGHVEQT